MGIYAIRWIGKTGLRLEGCCRIIVSTSGMMYASSILPFSAICCYALTRGSDLEGGTLVAHSRLSAPRGIKMWREARRLDLKLTRGKYQILDMH